MEIGVQDASRDVKELQDTVFTVEYFFVPYRVKGEGEQSREMNSKFRMTRIGNICPLYRPF